VIESWDENGQGQGGQMRNGMVKPVLQRVLISYVWPLCKQPFSFCFVQLARAFFMGGCILQLQHISAVSVK
jgi:hypothetical protein